MDVKNIANLFGFVGGLGMFLYGMHIMSEGIQKTAGGKMQQFLGMLTNNRLMAIGLGALITAIIHSSGATTVMVVGFVNAGILTLTHYGCKHWYNDYSVVGVNEPDGGFFGDIDARI